MLQNLVDNGIDVKKIFLGFIGFLIIIFLVISFVINNRDINEFLIIKEKLILTKKASNWKQVKEVTDKVLEKKYSVIDDSITKDVSLNYNKDYDSWYYFNSDYKDLGLTDVTLAYTDMFKDVKQADYSISLYEDSDYSIIKDVLKKKDISKFQRSISKVTFDLDGDGTSESIYSLTNESLAIDGNNDKKYSAIFLTRNGTFIDFLDSDHSKPYSVVDIIDLEGDGKYEVVVNKGNLDLTYYDSCFQIYKINGKKIKRIMDCK